MMWIDQVLLLDSSDFYRNSSGHLVAKNMHDYFRATIVLVNIPKNGKLHSYVVKSKYTTIGEIVLEDDLIGLKERIMGDLFPSEKALLTRDGEAEE